MLRVARMGLRYGPCLLISDGGVGEGGRTATVTGKSHLTIASQSSDQMIVFALLLQIKSMEANALGNDIDITQDKAVRVSLFA